MFTENGVVVLIISMEHQVRFYAPTDCLVSKLLRISPVKLKGRLNFSTGMKIYAKLGACGGLSESRNFKSISTNLDCESTYAFVDDAYHRVSSL